METGQYLCRIGRGKKRKQKQNKKNKQEALMLPLFPMPIEIYSKEQTEIYSKQFRFRDAKYFMLCLL